jgi:hypothetical protein
MVSAVGVTPIPIGVVATPISESAVAASVSTEYWPARSLMTASRTPEPRSMLCRETLT